MRTLTTLLVASLVGLGASLSLAAPAQAATGVSIGKVADRDVAPGAATTVKPKVRATGSAKVRSTTVVVSLDGEVVARGTGAATVSGVVEDQSYTVSTKVTYTVKGKTRTAKRAQSLTIGADAPECATREAVASVVAGTAPGQGDTLAQVVAKLGSPVGKDDISLADMEDFAQYSGDAGARAELDGYYAAGFTATSVHQFRMFTMCDDERSAGFVTLLTDGSGEGHVVSAFVEGFSRR